MVRPEQPDEHSPDPAAADEPGPRPSWAGATGYHPDAPAAADDDNDDTGATTERPGYQRVPDGMAAHAPMPGAPPYPAVPPSTVSRGGPAAPRRPADPTPFPRALAAAAVWLAVNLLVTVVLYGSVGTVAGLAVLVGFTLLVGLGLWLLLRRRALPFWQLVLIAAPLYWIVRLLALPPAP